MPTKKYKTSDGKRVPGVTTVIGTSLGWGKEGLLHWAWECGMEGLDFREERKNAANAGTLAHALAEADVKGLPAPPAPFDSSEQERKDREKAETAFGAYKDWKEMTRLKLVYSEVSLVSDELRVGGTLDLVAETELGGKKRLDLIDIKTSNGLYEEHLIQISAYMHLWYLGRPFETPGLPAVRPPFDGVHICRFSKSGDFHHSYYATERMAKPFDAFMFLRELYDLKKDIKGML